MFCICLCKILNKLPFLGNNHWLSHFLTFVRAILPAFSVHLGLQEVVVAPSHVSSHAAKWRSEDLYMKVLVIDVGGTDVKLLLSVEEIPRKFNPDRSSPPSRWSKRNAAATNATPAPAWSYCGFEVGAG